ncbi:putative D-inositol-3-phosphate glycosyltransferase [Hollandina sp. SP2]
MKILHVIGDLNTGGAQKLLTELLPCQYILGNDVTLLIIGTYNEYYISIMKNQNINVITANKQNIYSIGCLFFLYKNTNNYDIIHIHLFPALYYGAVLKTVKSNLNLCYTEHNTHNKRREHPYLRYLERFVYSKYFKVACISDETKEHLLQWLYGSTNVPHRITKKFHVIYNGIKLEAFSNSSSNHLSDSDEKIIMMISRFSKQKDHGTLIKAFADLSSKIKTIRLVLIGDGETKQEMEELVAKLNISNFVVFMGNRNDIPELIKSAYIGVQSSKWEGFGLTALEFMASGKPVIASNVPGLASLVKESGLLFSSGNVKNLSDHIFHLLYDEKLYHNLVEKGLNQAKMYSIKSVTY